MATHRYTVYLDSIRHINVASSVMDQMRKTITVDADHVILDKECNLVFARYPSDRKTYAELETILVVKNSAWITYERQDLTTEARQVNINIVGETNSAFKGAGTASNPQAASFTVSNPQN